MSALSGFSGIIGQETAVGLLNSYIKESRLSAGYLFSGPEGIGKRLAAVEFARQLNCIGERAPCSSCSSCLKIANNQHPDVHFIDNADAQVRIDDIRSLQRQAGLRPYEGKYKVFIIDNAQMLNPEAANALLKVLEEPPKDTLIILISDKPQSLFKTITSRCRVVKFSALKRGQLQRILEDEFSQPRGPAHFLAYYSEGRIGRALRLKETDIFLTKNKMIDAFVFPKPQAASMPMAAQGKEELRMFLNLLAGWFRDVYLVKSGIGHEEVINFDRLDELLALAGRFSFLRLEGIIAAISQSLGYLENNINSRLLLSNLGAQLWKD